MTLKVCSKCGESKPLGEFTRHAGGRDGYRPDCKACRRKQNAEWRSKNRETVSEKAASYYTANKDAILKKQADYYAANCDAIQQKRKERRSLVDPQIRRQQSHSYYEKRTATPIGRLEHSLRSRLSASLRRGSKFGRKTFDLLGYTSGQLRDHLEALFQPGMSWDNYGEWHVDHVVPLAALRCKSPDDEEFAFAWSLENLQPLWAVDNIRKNAKTAFRRECNP